VLSYASTGIGIMTPCAGISQDPRGSQTGPESARGGGSAGCDPAVTGRPGSYFPRRWRLRSARSSARLSPEARHCAAVSRARTR